MIGSPPLTENGKHQSVFFGEGLPCLLLQRSSRNFLDRREFSRGTPSGLVGIVSTREEIQPRFGGFYACNWDWKT